MKIERGIFDQTKYGYKSKPFSVRLSINSKNYKQSFASLKEAQTYKLEIDNMRPNCSLCRAVLMTHGDICNSKKYQKSEKQTRLVKFESVLVSGLTVDESPLNDKGILSVKCYHCKEYFQPLYRDVYNRIYALKGKYTEKTECHLYCGERCKVECTTYKRSFPTHEVSNFRCIQKTARLNQQLSKQDIIDEQLKVDWYVHCEVCGKATDKVALHHTEGVADNHGNFDLVMNPATHVLECKTCHDPVKSRC